jgi:hypothetical protein
MAAVLWGLRDGRPVVEVVLALPPNSTPLVQTLLADTGAGSRHDPFELILEENDCVLCGGNPYQSVDLGGAYVGGFPLYLIRVQIPALGFDHHVRAVGVGAPPAGLDGIAGFRFLSRFTYGNFGDPNQFGLETLPIQ